MAEVELVESATITKEPGSKGIYRIQLIEADVQGSTGFYPASVLERDGARAFPAGTHVFLDHPRESEEWERPERSVKDLAGVLLDAATYQDAKDGKGLFSRMQVFPDHKEFVEAKFPHMGMSIRALGIREYSSDTGLDTVTELVRGQSVDIVTRAGAGGRILEMTESARAAGKEAAPQVFELKETDKAGMQKLFEAVQALTTKVTQLEEKAATAEKKREEDATLSL
ncbi:MAG TPA: hypothetical protein VK054_06505, partial [Beutenbergiaceae bacterium]|nr:hypothetical protein [Beutenbergiaceae bacterium]